MRKQFSGTQFTEGRCEYSCEGKQTKRGFRVYCKKVEPKCKPGISSSIAVKESQQKPKLKPLEQDKIAERDAELTQLPTARAVIKAGGDIHNLQLWRRRRLEEIDMIQSPQERFSQLDALEDEIDAQLQPGMFMNKSDIARMRLKAEKELSVKLESSPIPKTKLKSIIKKYWKPTPLMKGDPLFIAKTLERLPIGEENLPLHEAKELLNFFWVGISGFLWAWSTGRLSGDVEFRIKELSQDPWKIVDLLIAATRENEHQGDVPRWLMSKIAKQME